MSNETDIYNYYLSYLNYKKKLNRFSNGAYSLLKISKSALEDFEYEYNHNEGFKNLINNIILSQERDNKINNLLNGEN
jgi:hypothetical protein